MIVDKLKKSFLQQAFEGKITHSLNDDTSVEKSLKKISVQKQLLIDAYKVRNEPEYKVVSETEFLFSIPKTWRWVRIGQLGVFKKGPFGSALTKSMFVKENENTVKVYEQKNAIQKDIDLGDYYITKDYFESKMKSFEVKAGDIIVSCAGTIGETYVVPNEHKKGIINQALMRMTMVDELNVDYFLKYFDYILKRISNNLSSGSAIKNIPPFDVFKQLLIPLPPIEEQQRIVDKLTELFSKFDEAKTIVDELKILKSKFPTDMKKSLLQYALSGKLCEQLSSDASIENMLYSIREQKKHYKSRLNTFNSNNNLITPFDIPNTWRWVKLKDIALDVYAGGDKPKKFSKVKNEKYSIPVIANGETNDGIVGYTDTATENENALTVAGRGTIGYSKYRNEPFTPIVRLIVIKLPQEVSYKYLQLVFELFIETGVGTSIKQLTVPMIINKYIPLPPIEEQQRIVDKLEQLLPLCDEIESLV